MTVATIKAEVRARDGHRCTQCGKPQVRNRRALDVHRLRLGGPYTLEGCVTLCPGCHAKLHGEIKKGPNPRIHKVVAHLTDAERRELEELRRRLPYEPDVAAVVRAAVLQFLAQARTTDKTD